MNKTLTALAAAALFANMASPCLAAEDFRAAGQVQRHSAAFAGGQVRLGLDGRRRSRPTARLRLATIHSYRDQQSSGPAVNYRAVAFELGAGGSGKATLFMNGREVTREEARLGVSTAGAVLIGLGAVALVAIALAASSDDPNMDFGLHK